MGCHVFLQGIFPTQELNPSLKPRSSALAAGSLQLALPGKSQILEYIDFIYKGKKHFLKILLEYIVALQYYIGFAIHWHESATGVHEFPVLNLPPTLYHLSGSSPCASPKHPVSCISNNKSVIIYFFFAFFKAVKKKT